jgi:flagellar hook-associated protein 1 FlgK
MVFAMTTDADGNLIDLTVDSTVHNSYYSLTAGNFKVTESILDNPKTIACAEDRISNGIEDTAVLRELIELKSDPSMFKQGRPDSFLQTLVGVMGIDAQTAKNLTKSQDNIVKAIETQRMSVSGVDGDEEAMDLVKFQSAYNLNSKVISIMNEVYDKLINETGV